MTTLSPLSPGSMTTDEFLVWAEGVEGEKVELVNGEVFSTAGGTKRHSVTKRSVDAAFGAALAKAGSPCASFIDDIAIRIDGRNACFPDVVVDCANNDDLDANVASEPVIVAEVLSKTTAGRDRGGKVGDYFAVPSIQHYLIVDAFLRRVTHHERDGDNIRTTILVEGPLSLDPPGITVEVADFWSGLPQKEGQ